jgi:hypothetical protein
MATQYTPILKLALPVTGELSGTWGDVVNDEITSLIDSAVAGTTTLTSDADVTLTDDSGTANQSRQAILLWTATGTVTRTITAPARTKTYVVINATGGTQSIKLVGVGPTTGVTIVANEKAVISWGGSDFIKVASNSVSSVIGTLPATNGGTGLTSVGTTGNVLTSDGTNWVSSPPAASGISTGKAIAMAMIFGF